MWCVFPDWALADILPISLLPKLNIYLTASRPPQLPHLETLTTLRLTTGKSENDLGNKLLIWLLVLQLKKQRFKSSCKAGPPPGSLPCLLQKPPSETSHSALNHLQPCSISWITAWEYHFTDTTSLASGIFMKDTNVWVTGLRILPRPVYVWACWEDPR